MNQRINDVINLQDEILDLIDETYPPTAITALVMSLAYLIAEIVSHDSLEEAVSMAQWQIAELVEKNFKEIEEDRKMWN